MIIDEEKFYNSKDREILISLLMEYSDKVFRICDQIERRENNISIMILTLMWLIVVSAFFVVFPYLRAINLNIKLLFYALLFPTFLFATFYVICYQINQRLKLLRRDAKTFSVRLEKVVRLASQIEEHSETNLVGRIELDLRIADAESALQHYESVQNNGMRNKFSVKFPF